MAMNPWNISDLDLTKVIEAVFAYARSQEERQAILLRVKDLGEVGVSFLEVLSQSHGEVAKLAADVYGQARPEYRKRVKARRLWSFGLRNEELERESHLMALRDAQEVLQALSLSSQPQAQRVLAENWRTVQVLRDLMVYHLADGAERGLRQGLVERVFRRIFEDVQGGGYGP